MYLVLLQISFVFYVFFEINNNAYYMELILLGQSHEVFSFGICL